MASADAAFESGRRIFGERRTRKNRDVQIDGGHKIKADGPSAVFLAADSPLMITLLTVRFICSQDGWL